jgi:hypothetical protein
MGECDRVRRAGRLTRSPVPGLNAPADGYVCAGTVAASSASLGGGPGFGAGSTRVVSPLKPAISRTMLILFVIGDVLGAGIYALVGEVGGEVDGAIWAAFLAAGVLAALTATAYSELVTSTRGRRAPRSTRTARTGRRS